MLDLLISESFPLVNSSHTGVLGTLEIPGTSLAWRAVRAAGDTGEAEGPFEVQTSWQWIQVR